MSVEYYLICRTHKEYVHVCSDGFSGPLLQCDRSLAAFVITHRNCSLSVADEHDESVDPEEMTEWAKVNWQKLLNYETATQGVA